MVKGTSKRIVVVKSPNPKIFEQAIFILKEDLVTGPGEKRHDVLKEAEKVADEYIRNSVYSAKRRFFKMHPAVFTAIGIGLAAAVWLTLKLLGV